MNDVRLITSLNRQPRNPRKITPEQLARLREALEKFGDLGGIVLNRRTGHLVGGNQRMAAFAQAEVTVTITSRWTNEPDPTGTVALGYVEMHGTRYAYREVDWDEKTEKAANLAANRHGGEFVWEEVSELLKELSAEDLDLKLTGFDEAELQKLMADLTPPEAKEIGDTDVRLVQLVLNVDTLPVFMERVQELGEKFETSNVTATVYRAVELCYKSHHEFTP